MFLAVLDNIASVNLANKMIRYEATIEVAVKKRKDKKKISNGVRCEHIERRRRSGHEKNKAK